MRASARPSQMEWKAARGALLLTYAALAGCARRATPAECGALLDRYVELLMREQDPGVGPADLAEKKNLARHKAASDEAFATCPQEISAREIRCVMLAPNVDEFEKCLE
jgi:hypothetical protein